MNTTRPSRPPRVRPAFRYLAIVSFIILVPVAAHAVWDHIEIRRLVREVQAIQARGEPLTEHDAGLTYRGTTEEHRRASQYYLAAAILAHDRFAGSVLATVREWVHGVPPDRSREEIVGELSRFVGDRTDALALADRASGLAFVGFTPGTAFDYRASALAQLSQSLAARTMLLSLSNDGDAAAASALSALRARPAVGQRWLVLGDHEVPVVLSFSSPSAAALERLQAVLQTEAALYDPVKGLLEDRARAIEMIWRRYYGPDPNAPQYYPLPRRSVTETVVRPWITRQTVATLRRWAETIALARQPWPHQVRELEALAARLRTGVLPQRAPAPQFGSIDPFYRGSVQAAADPSVFLRDRCAQVAVAVERYRRDRAGALPETLDDLVPRYLAAVPEDPLSGGLIRYTRDLGAYTIYSVGVDGRDDGGDLASGLHEAIQQGGRRVISGRDIGIRVLVR